MRNSRSARVLRKLATPAAKAGPETQLAATLKRRPTQNRPTQNRPTKNLGDGEAQIVEAKTQAELAELSAHPLWLVKRWTVQFGYEPVKQICIYDQRVPESSPTHATLMRQTFGLQWFHQCCSSPRCPCGS